MVSLASNALRTAQVDINAIKLTFFFQYNNEEARTMVLGSCPAHLYNKWSQNMFFGNNTARGVTPSIQSYGDLTSSGEKGQSK
jgi:hypothetical protein